MNDEIEILDHLDDNGNIIGQVARSRAHEEPLGLNHAVVNIWIVNRNGQLLCSRRSEAVKSNGGKWQTYFGGHVKAGKTYQENAVLELWEEIGLRVSQDDLVFAGKGFYPPARHFYENYFYVFEGSDDELAFIDGEISATRWFTIAQYWQERCAHEEQWCNGLTEKTSAQIEEFMRGIVDA